MPILFRPGELQSLGCPALIVGNSSPLSHFDAH